jgi:HAD superfamily phosphoserine phosphatase-like hydrolase
MRRSSLAVLLLASAGCSPISMLRYDNDVRDHLDEFLRGAAGEKGCRAVFDADGTLWSDDIGEAFLKWLIAEKKLYPPFDRPDLFAEYERLCALDKHVGYPFATQAMAGNREEDVRAWARDFARAWRPHIYPGQHALIRRLNEIGCEVWIVSASPRWLVEEAAPYLEVDPRRAVGMSVEVKDGRLNAAVEPPVTFREGKVSAITAHMPEAPWLVSGDSMTDFEMLEFAARVRLVIGPADREPNELQKRAAERGWLIQRFENPAR